MKLAGNFRRQPTSFGRCAWPSWLWCTEAITALSHWEQFLSTMLRGAVPSWLPHHVEKLKIRKAWEILLCLFYDGPIINMHWEWFFLKHEVECFSNLVCQAGVGPKASATNHWLGWQAIWSHSCEYALEWPCPWDFEGSAWWTVPSIESQSMGWLDEESSGCSHCAREDLVQLHCFFRLPLQV